MQIFQQGGKLNDDPYNYESRPDLRGRSLTSFVWKHFKRIQQEDDTIAECFYCQDKIVMPISKSTSSLRQHVMRKHMDKCSADLAPSSTVQTKVLSANHEGSVRSIPIPSAARENKSQDQVINSEPIISSTQKRVYNWDSFQQNVGCATVSMFQQKKKLKIEVQ